MKSLNIIIDTMLGKNICCRLLIIIITYSFFSSCQTDQNKQLVGVWEIDYINTKSKKKLNLPWQGIKFKPDGNFVSWNTRQHFEGTWDYQDDTLYLKGAQFDWMDSKWNIEIFTHPDHYRKIIRGQLVGNSKAAVAFQLSKVHHLYVDDINKNRLSKPGNDILLLGKWFINTPDVEENTSWLQFNENNTFLMGEGEDDYGNHGVWLLNEEDSKIDLISFSTTHQDISWDFSIQKDTLKFSYQQKELLLLKEQN